MKIAWFTPFSARSAIGEFSAHVTAALARHADVTLWTVDGDGPSHPTLLPFRPAAEAFAAPELLDEFDVVVYNAGNFLAYHALIVDTLAKRPGVVILHDRTCRALYVPRWLEAGWEVYAEKMIAFYGERGHRSVLGIDGVPLDADFAQELRFPFWEMAALNAEGLVVHSRAHLRQVRVRWQGPSLSLFLPTYPSDWTPITPPRRSDERTLLVTVGHVVPNKNIHEVVEVLAENRDLADRVRYAVVGECHETISYPATLRDLIEASDLSDTVELLGFQPAERLAELNAEADVFVNLRLPNLEGSSASLMRQLPLGKPILTYDTGVFAELPSGCVARVPPHDRKALVDELRRLVDDPARRTEIGEAGREHARSLTPERYADELLLFLDTKVRPVQPLTALTFTVATALERLDASPGLRAIDRIAGELAALYPREQGMPSDELNGFRELTPGDAPALGDLLAANDTPAVTSTFDPFPMTHESAAELLHEGTEDRFFGAFVEARLVALAMLRGWDEGFEIPSFGIFVDRSFHGQGIGGGLTSWTIEQARATGASAVRLSVYESNPNAKRLYEWLGFIEVSRTAVERATGADERIVMSKTFGDHQ